MYVGEKPRWRNRSACDRHTITSFRPSSLRPTHLLCPWQRHHAGSESKPPETQGAFERISRRLPAVLGDSRGTGARPVSRRVVEGVVAGERTGTNLRPVSRRLPQEIGQQREAATVRPVSRRVPEAALGDTRVNIVAPPERVGGARATTPPPPREGGRKSLAQSFRSTFTSKLFPRESVV